MSQNCVRNVLRCSGRMERRGFATGLVPDLWGVMKYRFYKNQINKSINKYTYMYVYHMSYTVTYISRICMLKLLALAAARFHFSPARYPYCTPVQGSFALEG